MSTKTKIMIVTDDEELVRRISLNKTANTRIIDLDNNNLSTSSFKDNSSLIDVAFLAQLSEPSPNRDQVYKRVLDLPQPKTAKVPKKTSDLICVVCGDHAIGFNYDAVTCASCKTFFRRNALQPPERIRCFEGQGKCCVSHTMRRKCPRCRLERCFAMGMQKNYFLTEEEKQRRRNKLDSNRHLSTAALPSADFASPSSLPLPPSITESISQMPDDIDLLLMGMNNDDVTVPFHQSTDSVQIKNTSSYTLSVEDWLAIQTVQSSYVLALQSSPPCPSNFSDRTSYLLYLSDMKNQAALKLITFFRQIEEFESLHVDDRFILIKYNLFAIMIIQKCLHYGPSTGSLPDTTNPKVDKIHNFLIPGGEHEVIYNMFMDLGNLLWKVTKQDSTLLRLLIVVLLFSKGLSLVEDEPRLNNPLAVNRAQCHYTRLLWNYLMDKYGENQTVKEFTQLLAVILKIQAVSKLGRDSFRSQIIASHAADQITPLMQSLLHIV